MMATMRSVSVVVPTRNRGASIALTIDSILAVDPLPLEVIVADQSDPDEAAQTRAAVERSALGAGLTFVAETFVDDVDLPVGTTTVRYLRCTSRGAGAGRNDGARRARGDVVLYTDDDTTVDTDWVAVVDREFLDHADLVAVYGRILLPARADGAQAERTGSENTRLGVRATWTSPTLPWDLGSGANMAFRRSAMLECGGFDEVLTIGGPFRSFEDLDLGHRLLVRRAGSVSFCPESVVYHHSTKTFREQMRTEVGYGVGAGAAFVKYRRCADPLAWRMLRAWFWHMAVRRSAAGVLKWRSLRVVRLACIQYWAPLLGIARSRRHPVDRDACVFVPSGGDGDRVRSSGPAATGRGSSADGHERGDAADYDAGF